MGTHSNASEGRRLTSHMRIHPAMQVRVGGRHTWGHIQECK